MKKAGLIILDGWGIGDQSKADAVYHAQTPFFEGLLKKYPHAKLIACGEKVGLPDGQMGNSEVGHLNIGAGRIVYQELTRINKAIREGDFFQNKTLQDTFSYAKKNNKTVHFIGLVSKGGVHSNQEHLYALCEMAQTYQLDKVFIHAFTDGRDCDPRSGKKLVAELEDKIKNTPIKIASIIGRYYAMDRDKRWERIAKAYHLLCHGEGEKYKSSHLVFEKSYEHGVTDEFILPSVITNGQNQPLTTIVPGDVVVCFNFRTDRPREIVRSLTQEDFNTYNMKKMDLYFTTMTEYDANFENIHVVFENDNLNQTIGEVVSNHGLTQLRIAETEKYPHVTFFFNGGREEAFPGEKRILVNSPKVATYDLQPEMSAIEVSEKITNELDIQKPSFFCLNFANPDMVGHTGVYEAIIKAVETVDTCMEKVVNTAVKNNYDLMIIADHGNADFAINSDGSPNTQHSLNLVPAIWVTQQMEKQLHDGILADVSPTLLEIMGIEKPKEMTGNSLIVH
jgi:2,3-bisphosphoglycerate-independent phosphoglycerate mutase